MHIPVKHLPLVLFLIVSSMMSSPVLADTREPQVQIESKLVEVNHSQTRELGVDFDHKTEIAETRGLEHLGQSGNLAQTTNVFDFHPLNFSTPQPEPKKIVPAPQIQVLNNKPAKISTTPLQLNVMPEIQKDGTVNMTVKPKVPELDLTVKPEVSTNFLIPDTNTALLGGLTQKSSEKSNDKVPLLGKIPMIGHLFKQQNKPEKKNLMVFVTPTIVQHSDH